MHREIKFRGKRVDNKEWVYGFYYEHNLKPFICNQDHSDGATTEFNHNIFIHRISQYTGLKDKKGKEIYEGDMLVNHKGEVGTVVWWQAGFHLECPRKSGDTFYIPLEPGGLKNKEIIGNIFETP